MEAATSLLQALGLSTAAGLRSYLTLLAVGLTSRFTDLIELGAPYDLLENPWALGVLAVLAVADFVGDKIPVVDHALHAMEALVNPAAGVIVALSVSDAAGVHPLLAGAAGLVLAGGTQAARMTARPAVTAGTAGLGNPLISLVEDVLAVLTLIVAILLPVLVVVLVALVAWVGWKLIRRARRAPAGRLA